MRTPFFVVILATLLGGLILFGLGDTTFSIADTSVRDNAATSRVSNASNSSASATITITMTGVPNE